MAYDPRNGEIYNGNGVNLPEGHYSLRASEYEPATPEDPIVEAQREASEAASELNLTPAELRTQADIDRVDELSQRAHDMASDANLASLLGRTA